MPTETASTAAPWFDTNLEERLTPSVVSFFTSYCNIEREPLHKHLHSIVSVSYQRNRSFSFTNIQQHQRAWAIRPYPCIGQWGFLAPKIQDSPAYATVLQRVKNGDTVLDFGCCMGQDLRYLAADGAPSDKMFGADIESAFWDLGYDLFQDRSKFQGRYLESDILGNTSAPATSSLRQQLQEKVDVVYAGAIFHLWDVDTQYDALKGLVELTKKDSMIVACQLGSVEVETKPAWREGLKPRLFHNADSIKKLWERVGETTSTSWTVEARIVDLDVLLPNERDRSWMDKTNRGLFFEATRVA